VRDDAAGDAGAGVAGRVRLVVVWGGVDDQRGAAFLEERVERQAGGEERRVERAVPGVTLTSLFKEGGTALVIHANPDDYKTDPAGNAGARIACGVIAH